MRIGKKTDMKAAAENLSPHELSVSIVQASQILDYLPRRDVKKNIHNWMLKKLFRPVDPVKPRSSRGARLSFSDLIVLAILDFSFRKEVLFPMLHGPLKFDETSESPICNLITPSSILQIDVKSFDSMQMRQVFDRGTRANYDLGSDRIIQRYLEALNFRVSTIVSPRLVKRGKETLSIVWILLAPSDQVTELAFFTNPLAVGNSWRDTDASGKTQLGYSRLDVPQVEVFLREKIKEST